MKLAVSNIAWANEEEKDVAKKLQELGVKYVEVAPTKLWDDPTKASGAEIQKYKDFWQDYGIEIIAFQSMLFNRPDLKLFDSDQNRIQSLSYLKDFIKLASKMGATRMVFGSPKNRQKGDLGTVQATKIAKEFFNELGDSAVQNGVCFCIEPNPTDYACDFVTNAQQGIEFVSLVSNKGFGLHLDIAGMTLAKDDIAKSITDAMPLLRHFHISAPFLGLVEENDGVAHTEAAKTLKDFEYQGYASIEMRPADVGLNVQRVEQAVKFAQSIYN